MTDLKIGDTIYEFDSNRRVYRDKKPGEIFASGPPIYAKYFVPCLITGETKHVWQIGDRITVNKRTMRSPKINGYGGAHFRTKSDMESNIFLHDNRRRVVEAIERIDDGSVLQSVVHFLQRFPILGKITDDELDDES